jgi:Na+/H+ ion antiporter subunit
LAVSGEVATRLSTWALRWLLLALLWLALADSRALPELVAAAVVAAIGAIFAGAIARPGRPRTLRALLGVLSLGPRIVLRPLWRLIVDTGLLTGALWRRIARGQRVSGSFRAAQHRPQAAARTAAARAVAEVWGSLMPNRYVVGIEEERGLILVHELIRTDEPLDPLARR